MRIRIATRRDAAFFTALAQVFSPFGRYQDTLPALLKTPGLLALVSAAEKERTGCVALGFLPDDGEPAHGNRIGGEARAAHPAAATGERALFGEVLVLGVMPAWQGRGIGRMLLEHVVAACEESADRSGLRAMRLTVADTNHRARALFESLGFVERPGAPARYENGQRAVRMERKLDAGD